MKQQLIMTRRHQRRSPRLTSFDGFLLGFWSLFLNPRQIIRAAVIVRPSILLKFHSLLRNRKYRLLYSSNKRRKPGPKGPPEEIIQAVVALKRHNPRFGCLRIAQQINKTFGAAINKDTVRRILNAHYTPDSSGDGPSWLSFFGHTKDSLWSADLFRCESILLQTHWVLVIMDQYTRHIVGFGIHAGDVDSVTLRSMFNGAISIKGVPQYLSSDNDPLFRFHRWQANLRILDVEEIRSIPYTPTSHPFIERLIGTISREYLSRLFFWNALDLERKLDSYAQYYNQYRVHQSLDGKTPIGANDDVNLQCADFNYYVWKSHCHRLFETPVAA